MDVFRTPDERFDELPGYAYAPNYVEVDGLRLHHLDEGSGSTVLCSPRPCSSEAAPGSGAWRAS